MVDDFCAGSWDFLHLLTGLLDLLQDLQKSLREVAS